MRERVLPGLKRAGGGAAGSRAAGRLRGGRWSAARRCLASRSCPSALLPRRPRFSRLAACSDPSRWGSRISRSASSGRSARARVISSKSITAGMIASWKTGPWARRSPRGPARIDPPGNALPPSNPTSWPGRRRPRARQRCPGPGGSSGPDSPDVRPCRRGDHPAGGAGARNDDQLGAVQRRQHRGERVPGIFTDEDRRPAPSGIECLDAPPGLDETLLVEDAVGRKEDLPVDVADPGVRPAERGVQPRVVEPVSVDLVEAQRNVERRGYRPPGAAG